MTDAVHFGCACCSPHFMPSFDHDAPEWRELIAALPQRLPSETPDAVIFHGGAIYPDPTQPALKVEAIGIADHRVVTIGSLDKVRAQMPAGTRMQALAATQALLPGLIDPHAHLMTSALVGSWVDLSPFVGQELRRPYDIDFIEKTLRKAVDEARKSPEPPPKWVCGFGVDPSLMDVWTEISAPWLDRFSPDVCIFLLNASGHISYVNTCALKLAGLDTEYPDGVLTEETSAAVVAKIPVDTRLLMSNLLRVFADANRRGITTLFDAGLGLLGGVGEVTNMRDLAQSTAMTVRVGAALYGNGATNLSNWLTLYKPELDSAPEALFSLRAIKLIADGSNQGLTGLQRQPYWCCDEHKVPGVGKYGLFNYDPVWELAQIMEAVADAGWPILTHANGDEGIANVLAAYQLALSKVPPQGASRDPAAVKVRHRIEHASLLDDEALRTMKQLSISPSFLIGHVGYWGKAFETTILGPERAHLLDRCASALAIGLRISLHSDHFVSPLGPLRYMEQSIGRVMEATRIPPRDGSDVVQVEVLNAPERLSVEQALRAVTIDAAWQCHLDDQIGSLLPGKQADLVIFEQDPLQWKAIDAVGMRDIVVQETWVSGVRVYSAA